MPEPYEICLLSLPCIFLVLAIISIYIASTLTDMACRFKAQESISASIYSKRQEQINSIYREIDNLTNRVEVLEKITKTPAEQELEDGALGKKLINQYSRVIERQNNYH